ncbi:hypothetical protein AX14_005465 [Amanita brunnescens Koide BX004]|nr:hypothetical protein AX14_005465 [Amanita brunnescens Koide BX004]
MYSVNVSGISPLTTKDKLHDFFSITTIDHKGQDATIAFEKPSAAKTALLLNGGHLDDATLQVTADNPPPEEEEEEEKPKAHKETQHPHQHEKPRAGIAAEYLASGYGLADHTIQRMIDFDAKQGISKRFLNYMQTLDAKVGEQALGPQQTVSGKLQATVQSAREQAIAIDQQKGISKVANDYYARAITSPWGQKVKTFYTTTAKQIQDIHEEARRIADQHKAGQPVAEAPSVVPQSTTQAGPAATQ